MSVTRTLAEFTADYKYEDIPQQMLSQAKRCIIDSLGCAIGGSATTLGKTIVRSVKALKGPKQSIIIGDGSKVGCNEASFVNTLSANLLDFDDSAPALGHPGNTIIPPSLAVGEVVNASGKDILLAVVLGYEVSLRIGDGIRPTRERMKLVYPIGCFQTYGAVVAASKLLKLDANQIVSAFGIAGSGAPLPMSMPMFSRRPVGYMKIAIGFASNTGVLAALMAKEGTPYYTEVFDSEGLWIMAGSDSCDHNAMVADLGSKYWINTISFKPYPSSAWGHSASKAVAKIVTEQKLNPEDIKSITVKLVAPAVLPDKNPRGMFDREFSLPWNLAMVILGEPPGPRWFIEDKIDDPKVRSLLDKITVEEGEEATRLFFSSKGYVIRATVDIVTNDGKTFTEQIDYPKGHEQDPFTDEELKGKFRTLALPVLGTQKTEKVIAIVDKLEELDRIGKLTNLLRGKV